MISLSFYRKLTLFLPSFTPAKQQILQGRVVLQDRRFCPDCLVRFQCVFFILYYPFVRSFVVVRIKVFQTKFPKEEEDKNYSLCSFSFFLRKTVQIERVFATREQSESVADQLFLCICLLSLAPLFTQTAKETSSNKNPANPSPPPRCRRWKSPKSPTPPRKSGTSPPLCSVAPSSVWRSVSCY